MAEQDITMPVVYLGEAQALVKHQLLKNRAPFGQRSLDEHPDEGRGSDGAIVLDNDDIAFGIKFALHVCFPFLVVLRVLD